MDKNRLTLHLLDIFDEAFLFDEINSSHTFIKNNIKNFTEKSYTKVVALAESQTQGKGQFERSWHSPKNVNIYCSFYYKTNLSFDSSNLSLIVGVSILECLKYKYISNSLKFTIKWPNDIFLNDMKLAGILIEQKINNKSKDLIISFGINVNMDNANLNNNWTSLKKHLNYNIDKDELLVIILNKIFDNLSIFNESGFKYFQSKFNSNAYLFNRLIKFETPKKVYKGNFKGINENGFLKIEVQNTIKVFSSGRILI